MERRNGILQMRLHTEGKALRWGALPHEELPAAFYDVGRDRDNKVVILTGTANEFSGPKPTPETGFYPATSSSPRRTRAFKTPAISVKGWCRGTAST